jgi:hypothetical protein
MMRHSLLCGEEHPSLFFPPSPFPLPTSLDLPPLSHTHSSAPPLSSSLLLPCLRYANRAKSIKNKPKINEDPKDAMIREFKEEIERLRKILSEQGISLGNGIGNAIQPTAAPRPAAPPAAAASASVVAAEEEADKESPRSSPSTASNAALISATPAPAAMVPMKPTPPPPASLEDSPESVTASISHHNTTDLLPMPSLDSTPSSQLSGSSKKNSPRGNSSPRSKNHIRSPRGVTGGGGGGGGSGGEGNEKEKEYIEKIIEIERIPESHLHKQKVCLLNPYPPPPPLPPPPPHTLPVPLSAVLSVTHLSSTSPRCCVLCAVLLCSNWKNILKLWKRNEIILENSSKKWKMKF